MKKITFLGDIMCEEPLLRASKKKNHYDFTPVFAGCKSLFSGSDLVVGNLETIFAGKKAGYTDSLFSFNTPDGFAKAMSDSGIGMVTLATNHSLDRDIPGLSRTIELLDRLGVDHIGACRSAEERNAVFIREFDGKKVSFLNYTYGTNLNESPFVVPEEEYYRLNLLMPQKKAVSRAPKGIRGKISKTIYRLIPLKQLLIIKKLLGRDCANRYTDTLDLESIKEEYLDRIKADVERAKSESDIVIVCLHIGGQFNEMPGEQVRYFTELFTGLGVDFLINTHAHVVQPCERAGSTFVAHCLGNFSISPSSIYVPHELKPEYSITLHLYVGEAEPKLTFSILKIVESRDHQISVLPADILLKELEENEDDNGIKALREDVTFIYNRFTGNQCDSINIQGEYPIEV